MRGWWRSEQVKQQIDANANTQTKFIPLSAEASNRV